MTPDQIEQAAGALAAARTGQAIPGLPEAARPQSEADSYAIQDAVIRRLGERVGGWKVGFSPEGGIFCAPIYALVYLVGIEEIVIVISDQLEMVVTSKREQLRV